MHPDLFELALLFLLLVLLRELSLLVLDEAAWRLLSYRHRTAYPLTLVVRGLFEDRFGRLELIIDINLDLMVFLRARELLPIILFAHPHISNICAFLGEILADLVPLHAQVAACTGIDQALVPQFIVLLLEVGYLRDSADSGKVRRRLIYRFEPRLV